MRDFTLVCPDDSRLIARVQRTSLVVRTQDPERIPVIAKEASKENHLHAVWLLVDGPLCEVKVEPAWERIRVIAYCSSVGGFTALSEKLPLLRRLSVQVFLPGTAHENFVGAQVLASLGISSGILLNGSVDWNEVNDLMHYAVYTRTDHAQVDPFHYATLHYDPQSLMNIGVVYFDDPTEYLHMNSDEEVALTHEELERGEIIAVGFDGLKTVRESEAFRQRTLAWQRLFLEGHPCASCSAWRMCGGRFPPSHAGPNGCAKFFEDLLTAAEYVQALHEPRRRMSWPS